MSHNKNIFKKSQTENSISEVNALDINTFLA